MAFHFCPQCGTKLLPDFKFCPSCGEKLPCIEEPGPTESMPTPLKSIETFTTVLHHRPTSSSGAVSARPPLRKTRNSLRLDNLSVKDAPSSVSTLTKFALENVTEVEKGLFQATSTKIHAVTSETSKEDVTAASSAKSPQAAKGQAKRKAVESVGEAEILSVPLHSPSKSPNSKSPLKGKSKKTKVTPSLEPLQEGTEVIDTTGKKWKLVRLLSQATTEMVYEVSPSSAKESNYTLKLAAKDGKIFNEQNFLQRAAKTASIEKWIKQNKMDFIGLPPCVGFGLHADSYRFLIFPNIGQSLHSLMNQQNTLLSEVTVLHIASRVLDILLYIHSHEYVHADINAKNIYINEGHKPQVYLVGYNHAFRFCPGGHHVELKEGSRTPHEGAMESISLDSHNGAGPSRRSDLQSLGYCMLYWHTGKLPWITLSQPQQTAAEKRKYIEDVPGLLSQCYGKKKVPRAFDSFLSVVMALDYNEEPDYTALKSGLTAALTQLGGSLEQPLSI